MWYDMLHARCCFNVVLQEAQPLLQQSIELVNGITPLLNQLSEGGLVSNLEALTATAADAAADIQKLQVGGGACAGGNAGGRAGEARSATWRRLRQLPLTRQQTSKSCRWAWGA